MFAHLIKKKSHRKASNEKVRHDNEEERGTKCVFTLSTH